MAAVVARLAMPGMVVQEERREGLDTKELVEEEGGVCLPQAQAYMEAAQVSTEWEATARLVLPAMVAMVDQGVFSTVTLLMAAAVHRMVPGAMPEDAVSFGAQTAPSPPTLARPVALARYFRNWSSLANHMHDLSSLAPESIVLNEMAARSHETIRTINCTSLPASEQGRIRVEAAV